MLRALFPLLLGLFGCASVTGTVPPEPAPAPAPPLRVAVIGASLSGGFGLRGELEADFDLARTLELALGQPAGEVRSLANNLFFQDAEGLGPGQVARARELEPTLVVGLDFLFWYAYGYRQGCEARRASFEQGLALLEELDCPLLVGDLLDATPALAGGTAFRGGRPVIRRAQIPSAECLAQLNGRLREWAGAREDVHVFPLANFYAEAHAAGDFSLRGNGYDAGRKRSLMQDDLLHSTYRGTAAIGLSALDLLVREGLVAEGDVLWDAQLLEQAVWQATASERAARRERRAEREAARSPAPAGEPR